MQLSSRTCGAPTSRGSSNAAATGAPSHRCKPRRATGSNDLDIRIIASDVDGTLVNSQQQLTAGVEAAVQRAHAMGVPVRFSFRFFAGRDPPGGVDAPFTSTMLCTHRPHHHHHPTPTAPPSSACQPQRSWSSPLARRAGPGRRTCCPAWGPPSPGCSCRACWSATPRGAPCSQGERLQVAIGRARRPQRHRPGSRRSRWFAASGHRLVSNPKPRTNPNPTPTQQVPRRGRPPLLHPLRQAARRHPHRLQRRPHRLRRDRRAHRPAAVLPGADAGGGWGHGGDRGEAGGAKGVGGWGAGGGEGLCRAFSAEPSQCAQSVPRAAASPRCAPPPAPNPPNTQPTHPHPQPPAHPTADLHGSSRAHRWDSARSGGGAGGQSVPHISAKGHAGGGWVDGWRPCACALRSYLMRCWRSLFVGGLNRVDSPSLLHPLNCPVTHPAPPLPPPHARNRCSHQGPPKAQAWSGCWGRWATMLNTWWRWGMEVGAVGVGWDWGWVGLGVEVLGCFRER